MQQEDSISTSMINGSLLNSETGMIEFFAADSVTYSFAFAKDKRVSFIKYDQHLSAAIDEFINFFADRLAISNNPVAFKETAYRLYQMLDWKTSAGFQDIQKTGQIAVQIVIRRVNRMPHTGLRR